MTFNKETSPPIVILKHGALGDLFLSLQAMQAVHHHHKKSPLILVTEPGYVAFAKKTGLFQEVWPDARGLGQFLSVPWRLSRLKNLRVYDFQNSKRTKIYFQLIKWMGGKFQWSGILPDCTYPYNPPDRRQKPVPLRLKEQLVEADVPFYSPANFDFLIDDSPVELPQQGKIVLLMPGCSKNRLLKRWPLDSFLDLANRLQKEGLVPIFLGGKDEMDLSDQIAKTSFINFIGKTSLGQVAGLIKQAKVWVGNDTGLTHLACLMGCPVVVPWSNAASNASIFSPQADHAQILSVDDLANLEVNTVEQAVKDALK